MATIEFSEITRDYAANLPLILRVRRAFELEIEAFWDALFADIKPRVAPLLFGYAKPVKQWAFWACERDWSSKDEKTWYEAKLWTEDAYDAHLVSTGELRLVAGVPCANVNVCKAVQAVAKRTDFSSWCKLDSDRPWYLFRSSLRLEAGADIASLGQPLANLLNAMHDACVAARPE